MSVRNPSKIFAGFLALHFLCWTVVPALFYPNVPLDVAEGFVWGRDMQWGYYKHPPLQAWLLESVGFVFGASPLGFYGLSAFFSSLGLWAVYRTGRLFTTKEYALYATVATQSCLYFTFLATEFNPNVLLLGLWPLAGYFFAKALLKKGLKHWLLLSFVLALGFYAKYATALLVISFVLFMLAHRETRRLFASPAIYLAAALGAALLAPHILWLVQHDFSPFVYAASRSDDVKNLFERFFLPFKFVLAQCAVLVAPCLALMALTFPLKHKQQTCASRLLFWLAFGPLILSAGAAIITGHKLRDMWGMPYLTFIPPYLISLVQAHEKNIPRFARIAAALFFLPLLAVPLNLHLAAKPLRIHFPGTGLSRQAHAIWEKEARAPLVYVIGESWLAGNIALYAPNFHNRPHVWIDGKKTTSPWINPDDVNAKGALVIWKEGKEPPVLIPSEAPQGALRFPFLLPRSDSSVTINYAVLKPQTPP